MSQRTGLVLIHTFLYFLLTIAVGQLSSPFWGTVEPNWSLPKAAAGLAGIVLTTLLAGNGRNVVNLFLHIFLLLIVTPTMVLMASADLPVTFGLVTAVSFALIALSRHLRLPSIWLPILSAQTLIRLLLILSLLCILALLWFGAGDYLNFDFREVYKFRRTISASMPSWMGYPIGIVSAALLPAATALGLYTRQWPTVLLSVAMSIVIFGLTAHKGPIFYPLAVIAMWFICGRKNPATIIATALIAGILLAICDYAFVGVDTNPLGKDAGWISALLVRRTLIAPALLNWLHIEFFSNSELYWWSYSRFTFGLFQVPYDLLPPNMIGRAYFDNADMSANTGYIGSGYANAKLLGVLFYSVVILLLFTFVASVGRRFGRQFTASLFLLPVITILTSSDLPTSILSHGGAVIVLIPFLLKPTAKALPTPAQNSRQGVLAKVAP